MKYFAYGSNMCTNRLKERVPSCESLSVAVLKEHRLRFHKKSKKDGSGKCNAYYTGNRHDEVIGVVFEIDPADKLKLDRAEGLRHGYNKKAVRVSWKKGRLAAFMYEADEWAIDDTLRPYTWYKDVVIKGATEHNLPEAYVKHLEAVPADIDPDSQREQAKRQIINAHGG
jgi:gamma-glutamylcyclotransferase (GGCT)/AIG2-like uncharacterized protein YtfP